MWGGGGGGTAVVRAAVRESIFFASFLTHLNIVLHFEIYDDTNI